MAKKLETVHGIVFQRQKFRDFDLLVRLMTQEKGFITLLVKGGLRPKSKLAASTMTFSLGEYVIFGSGRGISNLRTVKAAKQLKALYSDLTKNAYASFIMDLARHAFIEYQNIGSYFDLLSWGLKRINGESDPEIITQIIQLKLLDAYGLAPNLNCCVICGKKKGNFDYSIASGGLICSDHFFSTPRLHLNSKAVSLLRTMYLLPYSRLGQINVSPELKKKTNWAIDRIYRETADLNLKSKKFLDELGLLD